MRLNEKATNARRAWPVVDNDGCLPERYTTYSVGVPRKAGETPRGKATRKQRYGAAKSETILTQHVEKIVARMTPRAFCLSRNFALISVFPQKGVLDGTAIAIAVVVLWEV